MKTDELIKKRFQELAEKADAISKNRTLEFRSSENGVSYYKVTEPEFRGWATSVLDILERVCKKDSPYYQNFQKTSNTHSTLWVSILESCAAILKAAKEDYEGGYLFSIRSLTAAELFDDALEQATELLNAGYKDPACVVTGVVLETTLKELCTQNTIPHTKLDTMNVALCKAGIYNLAKQKQITAWTDLRNSAAHGNGNAYNKEDVKAFIEGVNRFIGDYL